VKNLLAIIVVSILSCCVKKDSLDDPKLDIEEFLTHMEVISDDKLLGRDTGTPGYDSASIYIENYIQELGLLPGANNHSFRQQISFVNSQLIASSASLSYDNQEMDSSLDFAVSAFSNGDKIDIDAPLVFAGFGIDNPLLGYSDFHNIDVSGKVALIIRGAPKSFGPVEQAVTTSEEVSNSILRAHGAVAVIRIIPKSYHQVRTWETIVRRASRPKFNYQSPSKVDNSIPSLVLNHQAAADIFRKAGKNYNTTLDSLLHGVPMSFDFNSNIKLSARLKHSKVYSHNLAGIIAGSDPELRNEFLVMTAHLDHIGVNPVINGDSINNGTLDNASGSAALMVIAKAFRQQPAPKRSILFLWVTAEEKGLLGSEYFSLYPTINKNQMVANLNIDGIIGMIVESTDVIAYGYDHSNLSQSVDFAVKQLNLNVSADPQPEQNIFVRSDQYSFVKQGYPALYVVSGRTAKAPDENGLQLFNNWLKHRYHKPSDDMDQPMNLQGIESELTINYLIAHHIVNELDSVKWNANSFLYQMFYEKGWRTN
jgi:Zn-dependent M28 family amino/carboxypeptidase